MQFKFTKSTQIPSTLTSNYKRSLVASGKSRYAATSGDLTIHVFDSSGNYRDKFSTKPVKEGPYRISAIQYSPDETRLAVAQSDGGLFVYKLGSQWGEKKSICNKFISTVGITHILFMDQLIVYGGPDGKIYAGILKSNKAQLVKEVPNASPLLAITGNQSHVYTTHADGCVYRYSAPGSSLQFEGMFFQHSLPITALAVSPKNDYVIMATMDKRVVIVNNAGKHQQEFDFSSDSTQYEITQALATSSLCILCSIDRLIILKQEGRKWTEKTQIIDGLSVVSSISFSSPFLYIASVSGNLCTFELYSKRSRSERFYIIQSSDSCCIKPILKDNQTKEIVLSSNYEFVETKIYLERFVVAFTMNTLVLHDMAAGLTSEIPWTRSGKEKFYFGHEEYCIVHLLDEASLVKFGQSQVSKIVHTPNVRKKRMTIKDEGIAFVNESNILVQLTNGNVHEVAHQTPIDVIELSPACEYLLFRDKSRSLFIYNFETRSKEFVYGNWILGCDVFIAQSRQELLICYTPATPTSISKQDIQGDVVGVEKFESRTRVVVNTEPKTFVYLDDSRTEFVSALRKGQIRKAALLLESFKADHTLWKVLLAQALEKKDLLVVQRCYSGMQDIAGIRFIQNIREKCKELEKQGVVDVMQHYSIKARLAVLEGQYKLAETLYLEQGRFQDAMEMYQDLHKWDKAISLAEARNHPDLATLKVNYFNWLVESGQLEQAAMIREREGKTEEAIRLYLRGGMPVKAGKTFMTKRVVNDGLAEEITNTLVNVGMYEPAGELLSAINKTAEAYEMFKTGKVYRQAIDLARRFKPEEVTLLEELWAENLLAHRQAEAAVNHFLEAGKVSRAVSVCSEYKQWRKLAGILDNLGYSPEHSAYYKQLAEHYESSGDYDRAEVYLKKAKMMRECVEMFTRQSMWQRAWQSAQQSSMDKDEINSLFESQAQLLKEANKLKEAEMVYLTMGNVDDAIQMYKEACNYDQMIRLVSIHHKDLLTQTLKFIARECQDDGNLRDAERFFVEAGEWKTAVAMYCTRNLFEDAFRVAKTLGGTSATRQVAYLWARSLGADAAWRLLEAQGLFEGVLDLALQEKSFDFALSVLQHASKEQQQRSQSSTYFKYAVYLEEQQKFKEAEEAYLKSGNPKEAIVMQCNSQDWDSAIALSERYLPQMLPEVLVSKGRTLFADGDLTAAETCLLRSQRPDLMIAMYQDSGLIEEAIRFAQEHLPSKAAELQKIKDLSPVTPSSNDVAIVSGDLVSIARGFEQKQDYSRAINAYLKIGPKEVNSSMSDLDAIWARAMEIAIKFVPNRVDEVTRQVADRLVKLQQFPRAAKLYVGLGNLQKAAEIYITAGLWDDARQIALKNPSINAFVENAYVQYLKSQGQADKLADVDFDAAMDLFIKRNQWDKCLEKAFAVGEERLIKYLTIYCDQMLLSNNHQQIIDALLKYGPIQNARDGFYQALCNFCLSNNQKNTIEALTKVLNKLKTPSKTVKRFCDAFNLICLREKLKPRVEMKALVAKQSVSLLRYADIIPADRLFYEAGEALVNAGWESLAFICWNNYLDLEDLLEEGKQSTNRNDMDFGQSDLPTTWLLTLGGSVDEKKREQVRDWILAKSLDSRISRDPPCRPCKQCKQSIFVSSIHCPNCATDSDQCFITGYPIDEQAHVCSNCGMTAGKQEWYTYSVYDKHCPKCGNL